MKNKWVFVILAVGLVVCSSIVLLRGEDVDVARVDKLVKQPQTFLLDVRSRQEFAEGHIKGAHLIPIQELKDRWGELPKDTNTPILVYCSVGGRSLRAHRMLKLGGYKSVYNLRGGINAWIKSGRPISSPLPGK